MIKPLKIFLFVSLSSLVLAACGSTTSSSNGTSPSKDTSSATQVQPTDKPPAGDTTGTGSADKKDDQTLGQTDTKNATQAKGTNGKETALAKEKQISLDAKGTKHAKGTLFQSTSTPIAIYTIPGYEVSDSKTSKEVVVSSKNESIKMTITALDKGVSMDEAKKNAIEDMQKVSKNVKEITSLKSDKFYQDATVLYASSPKEIESTYLLTIDGTPVKVTIERPEKTDSVLPYLQAMMKTISVKG